MDTVGFTRLVSKSSESEPSDCKVAGLGGWPAVRVGQFSPEINGNQKLAGPQTGTVELKCLVRSSVYPFTVNHLNSL